MFTVGQKVRIRGDYSDYTDHLDGMIGTIVAVGDGDCEVDVGGMTWMIWNWNMSNA